MAQHPDDRRAAALVALSMGTPVRAISRHLNIAPSTIRYWRDEAGIAATAPQLPAKTLEHLGESIGEYIDDIFQTASAILAVARDPAWLSKQPAGELAIFLGVISDKAVGLLDRIAAASGTLDPIDQPPYERPKELGPEA